MLFISNLIVVSTFADYPDHVVDVKVRSHFNSEVTTGRFDLIGGLFSKNFNFPGLKW